MYVVNTANLHVDSLRICMFTYNRVQLLILSVLWEVMFVQNQWIAIFFSTSHQERITYWHVRIWTPIYLFLCFCYTYCIRLTSAVLCSWVVKCVVLQYKPARSAEFIYLLYVRIQGVLIGQHTTPVFLQHVPSHLVRHPVQLHNEIFSPGKHHLPRFINSFAWHLADLTFPVFNQRERILGMLLGRRGGLFSSKPW